MRRLQGILRSIDGRGYGAYRELQGKTFHFDFFTLTVERVQADPYAPPSWVRVVIPKEVMQLPPHTWSNPVRTVALRDFLVRVFHRLVARDRALRIDPPGQEILDRAACQVQEGEVTLRFFVQLPARGRRILGREAERIFLHRIPDVLERIRFPRLPREDLEKHLDVAEDATFLRELLADRGLVAFVADGSILPRESGRSDRPLREGAIPFESPPDLRVSVELPHHGPLSGMGIPEGVTLIVGGGFHGKSTLLRALERGVYNHIPGDGREFVITRESAVKVRAEDGRVISGVDISPFIQNLPLGLDTTCFSTVNASGSTSQAACIIEALEAGAEVLLVDEDTSATNFMIRDARMQALIARHAEPIIPFVDRVRQLFQDRGVSTILVMGGSGDYLDVADTVITMEAFRPRNVTAEARRVREAFPTHRRPEGGERFPEVRQRVLLPGLDFSKGRREIYVRSRGLRVMHLGETTVELDAVEQIVEDGQVKAMAHAVVHFYRRYVDGQTPLPELLKRFQEELDSRGVSFLDRAPDLVAFRIQDFAAALSRVEGLSVRCR